MISPTIIDNDNDSNNEMNNNREEKLFWLIYRNNYLKRIIWKMVKSGCSINTFKYDQVNNVEWMLKNGHHQLLWSKVRDGKYLIFKCTDYKNSPTGSTKTGVKSSNGLFQFKQQSFRNEYYHHSIFNSFKNDTLFHSKLLSNYPMYFKPTTKEMLQELEMISIKYDNLALLQVLIKEYEFKPQFTTLESSIDNVSSEVANYLMLNFKFEFSQKQMVQLWKIVLSTDDFQLLNGRVELFLNKLCMNQPPIEIFTKFNLFNTLLYNQPLKSIIQSCETIIYLKQSLDTFINSFSKVKLKKDGCSKDLKSEKFTMLTFYEINEIKMKYINSSFMDMEIYKFNQENQDIKNLFNMLIMFTDDDYIFNNYKYYQAKYYSKYYKEESSLQSWKFGDFSLKTADQTIGLFDYCPNDTIKQQSYIQQIISSLPQDKSNGILNSLVNHFIDNIKVLKIILKEFKQVPGNQNEPSLVSVIHLVNINPIESPKLFEFILESIQLNENYKGDQFGLIVYSILSKSSTSINSFSRFFIKNYKSQYFSWIIENQIIYIDTFDRIHSNYILQDWSHYQEHLPSEILDRILIAIWENTNFGCLSDFKLLVQIFLKRHPNFDYSTFISNEEESYLVWSFSVSSNKILCFQQIDYILSLGNSDLINILMDGRIIGVKTSDLIVVSYLNSYHNNGDSSEFIKDNGMLNSLILRSSLKLIIPSLIGSIVLKSDIQLLEHLISKIKGKETMVGLLISNVLISYISIIRDGGYLNIKQPISFGNLTALKYITTNFKSIFETLKNQYHLETTIHFCFSLFNQSLNIGNIDILYLLIQTLGIDRFFNSKDIENINYHPTNFNFHVLNFFKFNFSKNKYCTNHLLENK